MANPNNVTLRSEKGSFLSFEEMDLNLTELQNLINEYNAFTNNTYSNFVSTQQNLNTSFNQFMVDQNSFNTTLAQDVEDVEILVNGQNSQIDNIQSTVDNLRYYQTDQGVWDSNTVYNINDLVTYNGISYISVVSNNEQIPTGSNWISYTSASIADQTFYDNFGSSLVADDVQSAIDELDQNQTDFEQEFNQNLSDLETTINAKSIDEFGMPEYESVNSSFSATSGSWYAVDSTSTAITITLPPSPTNGDTIIVLMVAGDVETNNITVARNGNSIEDLAEDMSITSNYPRRFKLYYNGTTWRVFI